MEGDGGSGRVAQFRAAWPDPVPLLGTAVRIVVMLREIENALLVPERAIRTAGSRRVIDVQDRSGSRLADVQVGLIANGQAEIVSGLADGQIVLVGP